MNLLQSIRERDEAKPTAMEVILAYPGFHIMTLFHPLAHWLWGANLRALARFWSYVGRFITGIEIHPGASIGKNLFIDHGTGVVIGQTAIIGDNCRLYHNVTLGGRGGEMHGGRRHPKLGNDVVIGAGAQVLGAVTISDGAYVGSASMVTIDVPPGMAAIGNPARLIAKKGVGAYGIVEGDIPDPLVSTIERMHKEMEVIKGALDSMKRARPKEYSGPQDI
ncbi:MAG TPA: serine O-acetyltransferase EpsC [Patescibacteria group bacterium]|jgi:serine O-acetyltransferase|nr:serine O-acetyltransferase EpsC [Patescibacteria group bacterium]